jgi:hypothetical protein
VATTRPRHLITESDQVSRALDDAAKRWPDEKSRAKLLVRLAAEGHRAVAAELDRAARNRRGAVRRTSGKLTGAYGADYLAKLRADWPE